MSDKDSYKVFHTQMKNLRREHAKVTVSLEKEIEYLNQILRRSQILIGQLIDGKL